MTISVGVTMLLALPVLWLGSACVRPGGLLARYAIPSPIVGGLIFALAVLAMNESGWALRCETGTTLMPWTWLVTAEPEWRFSPVKSANLPFLGAFFATVGLQASWSLVRRAGRQVVVFLLAVSVLAVLQNLAAVAAAKLLGISPLLGLVCGSMSMTGGHATTLGFASEFERAGLAGAQTFGMAAATLGLVCGAIITGPIGSALVRRHRLQASRSSATPVETRPGAFWSTWRALARRPKSLICHGLLLAACVKAGAWLSFLLQLTGLVFPVFVGTLVAGVALRFVLDRVRPDWFDPEIAGFLAWIALAVFLATAMMTLNLRELAHVAGPMLVILILQVVLMTAFAWWVTFPIMGRDYDAAVIAAGHCGFGLGSTSTAVAGMTALVQSCGSSPRAFLVVPLVGGFLGDLWNVVNLTCFISLVS